MLHLYVCLSLVLLFFQTQARYPAKRFDCPVPPLFAQSRFALSQLLLFTVVECSCPLSASGILVFRDCMCNVRQVFIMPPPQVSIEDGIRQGTHFIHGPDGYSYHFNREMKGGRLSLECLSYRSTCRGRASVNGEGREFRQTQRHNHAPDWCLLHERRFRSAVLSRCRNGDTETLRTIYDQERTRLRYFRVFHCAVFKNYGKLKAYEFNFLSTGFLG